MVVVKKTFCYSNVFSTTPYATLPCSEFIFEKRYKIIRYRSCLPNAAYRINVGLL
jgi:hypothetical protein